MTLLILASGVIGIIVIALLLVEFYGQALLAVAGVAVGFYLLLWAIIVAWKEWR